MRVRPEQLEANLARGLRPVYLVSGDEPLLVQEAADAIRARARAQGHGERELMNVEAGFDWSALLAACESLSLFAERRLIELRMPTAKPGDPGARALEAYAARPAEDAVLLIVAGKLDAGAQKSKWLAALDAAGVIVQVWPVDARQLPGWIAARMRTRGMAPTAEAVALLAARVEGNLLAAAQEIDKLLLLHGTGAIDADAVAAAAADSARFDVYDLAGCVLEGDAARAVRILEGLRGEGVEPPLVLWALARELRGLAAMAFEVERGAPPDAVLGRHRVWEKRKPLMRRALQRHGAARWQALLRQCGRVDRVLKGAAPGRVWDELLQLTIHIAGVYPLNPGARRGSVGAKGGRA
jgi:DNA polymerase III subunit delta